VAFGHGASEVVGLLIVDLAQDVRLHAYVAEVVLAARKCKNAFQTERIVTNRAFKRGPHLVVGEDEEVVLFRGQHAAFFQLNAQIITKHAGARRLPLEGGEAEICSD